jgi:YesN/AraC family two-component response regulator
LQIPQDQLKEAWFGTRVLSQKEHDAVIKLLEIFAHQLSEMSNQIVVQEENAEPPMITRAKQYIRDNQAEELSLGQVAKAVNASSFYFCKMFKKGTGVNFTEYVSRVRIESAKNLLLNPNLRISEIAYQVGFQSLTHFNRVFKKIAGEAPTEYRAKLRVN